ncbi:MAG: M28 family peptidase, partial [Fidelibacterota bacterium]
IAEAFIESPVPPKRSILFINFAGEEKGLLGSSYYTSNPIFPLERIVADLNLDMIGRNDSSSVYIIGSNMLSRDLHQFSEDAANELGIIKLDYKYNSKDDPKRFYYRSDHYNFSKYNIPVIFYFAGLHEDYHRPTDTIDKINFDKLSRVAKLAFVTGWKVANADRRPQLTELKAKK